MGIFRTDHQGDVTYSKNDEELKMFLGLINDFSQSPMARNHRLPFRSTLDELVVEVSRGHVFLGLVILKVMCSSVHPEFQKDVLELTTRVLQTGEGGSLEIRWQNERWTKLQVESISSELCWSSLQSVADNLLQLERWPNRHGYVCIPNPVIRARLIMSHASATSPIDISTRQLG